MTDLLTQYKPLHETQVPPQVYEGFTLKNPEPLGPEYVQKIREWKSNKEIQESKRRMDMELAEKTRRERESQLVAKLSESGGGEVFSKSDVNVISLIHSSGSTLSSGEPTIDAYEIELNPQPRSKPRNTSNIVVILDRDVELPLSSDPILSDKDTHQPLLLQSDKPPISDNSDNSENLDNNPPTSNNPSTASVFSPEQERKVNSLMSGILAQTEKKKSNEEDQQHPPTTPSSIPSKPKPLKVPELRALCKKNKLATDGTKDVLIRRLKKNNIIE